MSRLRHTDIIMEMVDLCHDIIAEIRHQLTYYRASVYKDETAGHINDRVARLRMITTLIDDDLLKEPIRDFDAVAEGGIAYYVPGECTFSTRVTNLLTSFEDSLKTLPTKLAVKEIGDEGASFKRSVQDRRQELLAVCQHGSRQWSFFRAL